MTTSMVSTSWIPLEDTNWRSSRMVIETFPLAVYSCGGAPTITATAGTGTFTIGGSGVNAAPGASTWPVTVDVTPSTPNPYTNWAGNVTVGGVLTNGRTNPTPTLVPPALSTDFSPTTP